MTTTASTHTARRVTQHLRAIWAKPMNLSTKVADDGATIVVTFGAGGMRWADEKSAELVSLATGRTYRLRDVTKLRGNVNARATYILAGEDRALARSAQLAANSPALYDAADPEVQAAADKLNAETPNPFIDDTTRSVSRRLPTGWTAMRSRAENPRSLRYVHWTGVEVERNSSGWFAAIPARPGPTCPPGAFAVSHPDPTKHFDSFETLDAAMHAAETHHIPRTIALINKAWDDALFHEIGKPAEWPIRDADDDTVAARRAAVQATGTRTGRTTNPGEFVIHIVTGVPGRFHGIKTYKRPFHGMTGDLAAVTFAGVPFPQPVSPDDVIAIREPGAWFSCNRGVADFPEHLEHGEAESPECLLPLPDARLKGYVLAQTADGRYVSRDGIEVVQAANGTWTATGPSNRPERDFICGYQPRLAACYRWINEWRAEAAQRLDRDHAHALRIVAAQTAHRAALADYARAGSALTVATDRNMPGTTERAQVRRTELAMMRTGLALDLAEETVPVGSSRLFLRETSYQDGPPWELCHFGIEFALPGESASDQAARLAEEFGLLSGQTVPARIVVFTDPTGEADGEWTNLTDPCPPGEHKRGAAPVLRHAVRDDGSSVEVSRCGLCFRSLWRVTPPAGEPSPWQLEGDPLPPVQDGRIRLAVITRSGLNYMAIEAPRPDRADARTLADTQTPTLPRFPRVMDVGVDGRIAVRFRVSTPTPTPTGADWKPVASGETDAIFRATNPDVLMVADTVMSNVRPILGLRPDEPAPTVRVQTWHATSGLAAELISGD